MSRYLLDTHIAVLGLSEPEKIPLHFRQTIDSGVVYLSVISYWEVSLKAMKGKLDVGDPRIWWAETVERFAAVVIPVRATHISAVHVLPPIHKDPFDRALIAQAIVEEFTFVSLDSEISEYASERFRLLR